jgi:hypothetical protein
VTALSLTWLQVPRQCRHDVFEASLAHSARLAGSVRGVVGLRFREPARRRGGGRLGSDRRWRGDRRDGGSHNDRQRGRRREFWNGWRHRGDRRRSGVRDPLCRDGYCAAGTCKSRFTEYAIGAGSNPAYITSGQDGNLWFTTGGDSGSPVGGSIGRLTVWGTPTLFPILGAATNPNNFTVISVGIVWTERKRLVRRCKQRW